VSIIPFLACVACFYVGLALLAIDGYFEPWTKYKRIIKIADVVFL
jgi:hypothetical protein